MLYVQNKIGNVIKLSTCNTAHSRYSSVKDTKAMTEQLFSVS